MTTIRDWMLTIYSLAWLLMATPVTASNGLDDWRAAVAEVRALPTAAPIARADFLLRPAISSVQLAPDGRHLAYLLAHGNTRSVWLMDTAGAVPRRLLSTTDAQRLQWTRDAQWLLLESPTQLFALAAAGQQGSGIVTTLAGPMHTELLAVDPVQPAAVIILEQERVAAGKEKTWRLQRVDVRGVRSLLHEDSAQISNFAFNRQGRLAFLQRVEGEALVIHRVDADGGLHEFVRCAQLRRCTPLTTSDDGSELIVRGDLGSDLSGVLRLDRQGGVHMLHRDPLAMSDIDTVSFDPLTGMPLIASYRSIVARNYALSDDIGVHVDAIERLLPQRNLQITVGRGADAQWLISVTASNIQGTRWQLYDPRAGTIRSILDEAPLHARRDASATWLPDAALARKIPISWRASDGMRLHGFVLLPSGVDPASVPLIASIHGGPFNHLRLDYSASTQLLVNRGYAVFEPNFRGSTGHGRDYMFAANGDFGNGRVQQDIVEGVHHVLAEGIGDPQRIGIIGASFGGYAALLGMSFSPELFKVGVANVPPPDFGWNLLWMLRSTEAIALSGLIPIEAWLRMLSLDVTDAAVMTRLQTQSPLAHADKVRGPLLLIAGGADRRVALRGVIAYAAKLRLLGKDFTLLVDPDAGHSIDGPLAHEAQLYLIEKTLQATLGGPLPSAPDSALRKYLHDNLRVQSGRLSVAAE